MVGGNHQGILSGEVTDGWNRSSLRGGKRNQWDRESLVSSCKIPDGSLGGVLRRARSCSLSFFVFFLPPRSLSEASGGHLGLRCFEKSGRALGFGRREVGVSGLGYW